MVTTEWHAASMTSTNIIILPRFFAHNKTNNKFTLLFNSECEIQLYQKMVQLLCCSFQLLFAVQVFF